MKKDTSRAGSPHAEIKQCELHHKTDPLAGALCREWIRCGRPNCRCATGEKHGPYYYHLQRIDGQQRRRYVKRSEVAAVQDSINVYRTQRKHDRMLAQMARVSWSRLVQHLKELGYAV